MHSDLIKRIIAIVLLGALLLGLVPMIALAAETTDPTQALPSAEAVSVGIIGGADGPTAIFVTGSPLLFAVKLAAVVCAGALLILLFKKRKA